MNTSHEHYREYPADRHDYPARSSGARIGLLIAVIAILAVIAAFALGFINVNQTQKGSLPQVSVSGGQAPSFDVDTAKVSVGTKTTEVDVPKVSVGSAQKQVEVPTVDVQKAQ